MIFLKYILYPIHRIVRYSKFDSFMSITPIFKDIQNFKMALIQKILCEVSPLLQNTTYLYCCRLSQSRDDFADRLMLQPCTLSTEGTNSS